RNAAADACGIYSALTQMNRRKTRAASGNDLPHAPCRYHHGDGLLTREAENHIPNLTDRTARQPAKYDKHCDNSLHDDLFLLFFARTGFTFAP
ncbi:MAG: hypothetical protein RR843_08510, partial [Clostridia bacterium]